jgi:lysophospholipase L1-like esterase
MIEAGGIFRLILLIGWLALGAVTSGDCQSQAVSNIPSPFETEVNALDLTLSQTKLSKNPIVFYGSSSFRLWKSMKEDFSRYSILNCGFGGSRLTDCVQYAKRLVICRKPAAIVIYAGDNDLALGLKPETVFQSFQQLFHLFRSYSPSMPIAFVSVKPSPGRLQYLDSIFKFNKLVEEYLEEQPETDYIDICSDMLGPNHKPNATLFVADQIHLNQAGYRILTKDIGEFLTEELPSQLSSK